MPLQERLIAARARLIQLKAKQSLPCMSAAPGAIGPRHNRILALFLPPMTATDCPQCGSAFECGAQPSHMPCWCVSLPALPPQELGRLAATCYCPACLRMRLTELGLLEPS